MTNDELPNKVKNLIGKVAVKQSGLIDVQKGLWQNFCSAIEDGNPMYWDKAYASKHTDGIISHPAILPSWLHDFEWHPKRDRKMPMELHFLIKELLSLPLGIVTEVEIEYFDPVHDGDLISCEQKLISVSDLVKTKLGKGRYWTIEVIYKNQLNQLVGKQNMHFLGYKR
tara:strand:- start:22 stop:528 length:507 start_codon:yes stop_codon:yes gene_type:complete